MRWTPVMLVVPILGLIPLVGHAATQRDLREKVYRCLLPMRVQRVGTLEFDVRLRVIPGDRGLPEWGARVTRQNPGDAIEAIVQWPDGYRIDERARRLPDSWDFEDCEGLRREMPLRECRLNESQVPALRRLVSEMTALGFPALPPTPTSLGTRYDLFARGFIEYVDLQLWGPSDPRQKPDAASDPTVRWANELYATLTAACTPVPR